MTSTKCHIFFVVHYVALVSLLFQGYHNCYAHIVDGGKLENIYWNDL